MCGMRYTRTPEETRAQIAKSFAEREASFKPKEPDMGRLAPKFDQTRTNHGSNITFRDCTQPGVESVHWDEAVIPPDAMTGILIGRVYAYNYGRDGRLYRRLHGKSSVWEIAPETREWFDAQVTGMVENVLDNLLVIGEDAGMKLRDHYEQTP